ncbi:MAG: DUF3566 domain-containing protein [Candidatus Zixiibacteriota bacterium]|nr:MAG: DUF3566 domain-containing protein [candidate division Zixibacteria bacterium]
MKFELHSIGYWSLIKISFIINLIVGLCVGFFFAIFVSAIMSVASQFGGMGGMPMFEEELPSIGILIIMYPFLFGFGGAIFNTILFVIIALVYNIAAKLLGGIEVELKQVDFQPVPQMAAQPSAYYARPPQPPPQPQQPAYPAQPPPPPPSVQPLPPDVQPPDEDTDRNSPQG